MCLNSYHLTKRRIVVEISFSAMRHWFLRSAATGFEATLESDFAVNALRSDGPLAAASQRAERVGGAQGRAAFFVRGWGVNDA